MPTGKILSINADKGFGFLQPAEGGPDLFFHCSVVDAEFSTLRPEQVVQYTVDASATKPRAKEVLTGAATRSPSTRSPNSGNTSSRPPSSRPPSNASGPYKPSQRSERPKPNVSYGFITKLPRKDPIGFISSDKGGHEYYFEPKDVFGKSFTTLCVGDYVSFIPHINPDDPKQPFAKSVKVVPKPINRQENRLARHPRAQRKKPTWRQ